MPERIEVATRSSAKCLISGCFQIILSLPFLGVAAGVVWLGFFHAHTSGDPGPWIALAAIPALLVGWSALATGVRRLRQIGRHDFHIKAGPDGLSLRVPGRPTWSSLRFGYRTIEADLRWDQVKRYYPWVMRINGIPTASEVRVELVGGGWYSIPAVLFRESRTRIAAKIEAAAKAK